MTGVAARDHGPGPRRPAAGFTLIELLVALLLFAVLSVMAYGGLRSVLDARARTELQAAELARLQTLFTLMGRDIEQAIDRPVRDGYGDRRAAMLGGGDGVEFTRTGWRNPAGFDRSHLQRVAYVLDDTRLKRRYWRVLDRAPDSEFLEATLLEAVNRFEVRFLDRDREWQVFWPGAETEEEQAPGLPLAVEVTLEFERWGRITRLFPVAGG